MEEEKAADYYDNLVRNGVNAAKYKQGLGFGTHATSVSNNEGYSSLTNFVKAASPGTSAALHKEIRIERVRDKLKKRASSRECSSRQRSLEKDREEREDKAEIKERGRRRTPDLDTDDWKQENSSETLERSPVTKISEKDRRRRSRDRSSRGNGQKIHSPSTDNSTAEAQPARRSGRESRRQKLQTRGRRSCSYGSDGICKSSDTGRKLIKLSGRDWSFSLADDSKSSRHRNRKASARRKRSRSRSYDGRRRDWRRSHFRGGDSEHRRDRACSPDGTRRSGRALSPKSHRSAYNNTYRDSVSNGRPDSRHLDGSRRTNEEHRTVKRCSGKNQDAEKETAAGHCNSKANLNPPEREYCKAITSFEFMTSAEKVKAKMKIQLSETGWEHASSELAIAQDQAKGIADEWERFNFDKGAPLDDDAKLDYFGDGIGASDDTLFLKNTGSTFLSSSNQVTRETWVSSMHETAIFGPPGGLSVLTSQSEGLPVARGKMGHHVHQLHSSVSDIMDSMTRVEEKNNSDSITQVNSVVSEQVIAMQQAGSWQQRAQQLREVREAALAS